MANLIDTRFALWALLAIPAALMLYGYATDTITYGEFIHESGDWSVRLLIFTLSVTPLRLVFASARFTSWLMNRRRDFGVATFAYALLHTLVYVARKADISLMVREGLEPELWTGWLAFAAFAVLAITSNGASVRLLRTWWKKLHRLVYAGAILTFAHWVLEAFDIGPALIYAGILASIEVVRITLSFRRAKESVNSA